MYAALDLGHFGRKLHRSRDGGRSFTECGAPTYPPKPEDADDEVDPNQRQPIPWTTKLIWALSPGGTSAADRSADARSAGTTG